MAQPEALDDALKYRQWRQSLDREGVTVHNIEPLHIKHRRNGEVLFAYLRAQLTDPDGHPIPDMILVRGEFVTVACCLWDIEERKRYYLLVGQRRICNGALFYEHPAGMCDSEPDPAVAALHELEEEAGIVLPPAQLIRLHPHVLYSSPGLTDEGGIYFGCVVPLPTQELWQYHNRRTGLETEGEYITTILAMPDEARGLIRNSNGLLNYYLFEQWWQEQGRHKYEV